jgi:hypothetical protein
MAMDAKEPSHLGCAYLSTKSLFLGGIYKRSQTPNKTIWYFQKAELEMWHNARG